VHLYRTLQVQVFVFSPSNKTSAVADAGIQDIIPCINTGLRSTRSAALRPPIFVLLPCPRDCSVSFASSLLSSDHWPCVAPFGRRTSVNEIYIRIIVNAAGVEGGLPAGTSGIPNRQVKQYLITSTVVVEEFPAMLYPSSLDNGAAVV
jgi:hypothetical protein